eukprot:TRINITY_DN21420_c0_g1_i1.p1 TRINITY_DN21420_c0_g1~~TRINITY_DN21420_c0_g1_i1.p1  ORF type:complete len:712 (+),score=69.05 TRINITY_DN21420_c0_g1_i1:63-2198(+)
MPAVREAEGGGRAGGPLVWALISALLFAAAYVACAPVLCSQILECEAKLRGRPRQFYGTTAWVLVVLLLHELTSLVRTWRGSAEVTELVEGLRSRALPSLLLSICFATLGISQWHYAISDELFVHASPSLTSPSLGGFNLNIAGRPVYTAMYLEWMITVPCLLGLCGYCALGRPLQDMLAPIIATNVYILLCWAALLVDSVSLRLSLIGVSLLSFAWVSCLMMKWTSVFRSTAPADLPSRTIRPLLTEGIILLFCVYGLIFVMAATDSISCDVESMVFSFLNVGSKLGMSIAFVIVREDEYNVSLSKVLHNISHANLSMVSILRGSFDHILPCQATPTGDCCFPLQSTPDMMKLEAVLGRSLAGVSLVDLVAGQRAKDDFNKYIWNTLRQASSERALDGASLSSSCAWHCIGKGASPPVAQVVHCPLLRARSTHKKDSSSANATNGGFEAIRACIHTSVVPDSAISFSEDRLLVVAIQLTFEEQADDAEEEAEDEAKVCDAPEHAVGSDVQRLVALKGNKALVQDDTSSHCASSKPHPNFVGGLADLALMGIDIIASSWSQTESEASFGKNQARTNNRSLQSTAKSEAVVFAGARIERSRVKPNAIVDPTKHEKTEEVLNDSFWRNASIRSPRTSDTRSNDTRHHEIGEPCSRQFSPSVDNEKTPEENKIRSTCSRAPNRPTWAQSLLLSGTAFAAVVVTTVALRVRSRKL